MPELEPAGVAAGLHLVAWLPQDVDEATVIVAAAREGVAVAGVSPYRLSPAPRGGLIFGYSNLNEHAITVQGQRDGERRPRAEQADGVHDDEREAAGAEPVGQPDRVTAGIGGQETCRHVTR